MIRRVIEKKELPAMKLPSGTGVLIEPWSKGAGAWTKENGHEDIPPVVTDLSGLIATNRTDILKEAVRKSSENGFFKNRRVKNVIVLIGDGMGETHLKGSRHFYGPLLMDEFPLYRSGITESLSWHKDDDSSLVVTDSSAAGTALMCGVKTRYGYIGLDKDGNEVKNLGELAREMGKFVGVVTNDHMGDSTPASAIIHDTARENEEAIYKKEFEFAPDILIGHDAGIRKHVQTEEGKKRGMVGYESFPAMCEGEKSCGYANKAVSFWGGNFVEYEADTPVGFNMGKNDVIPTFPEMVAFTLTDLDHKSKAHGNCGFFCMIENTCCDGWGHAQQVPQLFNEVQCFDEGAAVAAKFVLENPDTLLIVTADHENGCIRFRTGWEENIGMVKSMEGSHSALPVPVIAFGAGAEERFPKREEGLSAENFQTGQDIIYLMENKR